MVNPSSSSSTSDDGSSSWGGPVQNVLLIAVALGMVWLAFNVQLPSLGALQRTFEGLGFLGWVGFVAAYAVVALTPIPVTIMAVAGGVIFGTALGSALSIIGVLLGSWGAYWIARALGQDAVYKLLGKHAQQIQGRLLGAGFEAVCLLRLTPGIPYWPVNYGSGAFGVKQNVYLSASILSIIPGQVSLVAIGAFIASPDWVHGVTIVVAWVAVIGATVWAFRQWRQTSRAHPPEDRTDT